MYLPRLPLIALYLSPCSGRGKSQLDWGEFVDGAISLSAAVSLTDALSTVEERPAEGAVPQHFAAESTGGGAPRMGTYYWDAKTCSCLGLDAGASPRFTAFFMTGRFVV